MAVGDGGFSTRAMGFDKNEVNEYISNLRKKMNELTADMKEKAALAEEAKKTADFADMRVREAEIQGEKKARELEEQLAGQQTIADSLRKQVDEFKQKLEEEKRKMSDMLKNGKGVNAEAKRAYAEIIDKANDDAAEIVDKAKNEAAEIISEAQRKAEETNERLNGFMEALSQQLTVINGGYRAINASASELLGTSAADISFDPEAVPDASVIENYSALGAAPVFRAAPAVSAPAAYAEEETGHAEEVTGSIEDIVAAASAAVAEINPDYEEKSEEPEGMGDKIEFGAGWGGAALEEEDKAPEAAAEDKIEFGAGWGGAAEEEKAPEQPTAEETDAFADTINDMFSAMASDGIDDDMTTDLSGGFGGFGGMDTPSAAEASEPLSGFEELGGTEPEGLSMEFPDLSGGADLSFNTGSEPDMGVTPLDNSDSGMGSFDHDFTKELLAQTIPSGSLGGDMDDSLREAVMNASEKFAVKPLDNDNDMLGSLTMDEGDFDDPMQGLREASAALGLGGSLEEDSNDTPLMTDMGGSNPWDDLQKQLEQLEQSGGMNAGAETQDKPEEPAAPSADDASIWNFGDAGAQGEGGDDDMSSDMFGGFGGF